MGNGPIEPSADMREIAAVYWQLFVALQLEGFNEKQALTMVGHVIAAAFNANKSDD